MKVVEVGGVAETRRRCRGIDAGAWQITRLNLFNSVHGWKI